MRRLALLIVAALLLCLPGMSEAQSCDGCGIGYRPSGVMSSDQARRPFISVEVFPSNPARDFVGSAVASGTQSNSAFAQTTNHPGVSQLSSSGSANSGYQWYTGLTTFLIGGNEVYEGIFYLVTLANVTARLGFIDNTSSNAPVDGIYITIPDTGVVVGTARANSTSTDTAGATYTVSHSTWYRIRIVVDSGATSATFFLFSESGALLWTDSVASNLPTGAGRQTGAGAIATESAGATAALMVVDYMAVYYNSDRAR